MGSRRRNEVVFEQVDDEERTRVAEEVDPRDLPSGVPGIPDEIAIIPDPPPPERTDVNVVLADVADSAARRAAEKLYGGNVPPLVLDTLKREIEGELQRAAKSVGALQARQYAVALNEARTQAAAELQTQIDAAKGARTVAAQQLADCRSQAFSMLLQAPEPLPQLHPAMFETGQLQTWMENFHKWRSSAMNKWKLR